jgi:hypothetical protein
LETIGDGNCYFHALLTLVDPQYQKMDFRGRTRRAQTFRREAGSALTQKDPETGVEYWFAGMNIFSLALNLLAVQEPQFQQYSQTGLSRMLQKTGEYIGDEMYAISAALLGLDIYLLISNRQAGRGQETLFCQTTADRDRPRPGVVLYASAQEKHYSSVVHWTPEQCTLVFSPQSPILEALRNFCQVERIENKPSAETIQEMISLVFGAQRISTQVLALVPERDVLLPYLQRYNEQH